MPKKKIIQVLCFAGAVFLAGCSSSNGPHGGHTTKWYEQHTAARRAENHWCGSQSDSTQMHSKSCARVADAAGDIVQCQEHIQNQEELASMNTATNAAAEALTVKADAAMSKCSSCLGGGGTYQSCGFSMPEQVINGVHHYTIDEFNYYYKPGDMIWHVGEKVELTLVNQSQSAPPIALQFAIGRTLVYRDNGSQKSRALAIGFKNNFFNGVPIQAPPSRTTAPIPAFSVSLLKGQHFTFSFAVPNKPGKWEYGSFLQAGQQFMNGMHGNIRILPATATNNTGARADADIKSQQSCIMNGGSLLTCP